MVSKHTLAASPKEAFPFMEIHLLSARGIFLKPGTFESNPVTKPVVTHGAARNQMKDMDDTPRFLGLVVWMPK